MKNNLFNLLALLLISFNLSCASMSKEQCQMGNWYDYGHSDGMMGEGSERLIKHAEACQKHGVTPDREQYIKGHAEGLRVFCEPQNAYQFGLRGGRYRNNCPSDMATVFLSNYNKGKEVYDIKNKIQRLENEIKIASDQMVNPEATPAQRTKAIYDLRDKEREKSNLERRLLVIELRREIKEETNR